MAQTTDYKFEGWLGLDSMSAGGNMVWGEFQPKTWEESDVDIKVTHCGVCCTDLHVLRDGWPWPTQYPICVGHEIVGRVVRVGLQVEGGLQVGDLVGVGAQSESCLGRLGSACRECDTHQENYCQYRAVPTYNGTHVSGDRSMGGYATYFRGHSRFAVRIPAGLDAADAAPMLCAGVSTLAPLRHHRVGPGKTVGIIGFGGLGHLGSQWARALGADRVVVVSRTSAKRADAMELGATDFIATAEDAHWAVKYRNTLDVILSTVSCADVPINDYLDMLRFDGTFVQLGAPDDVLPGIQSLMLIFKRLKVTSSCIGSPDDIRDTFQLAAETGVRPWVTKIPMKDANKAIVAVEEATPRYRYTLVNEE